MSQASLQGDFFKLRMLIKGLETMAKPSFRASCTKQFAEEGLAQVLGYFRRGAGPYGFPWPSPKHRPGGRPLVDTTRLQNSISVRSDKDGFSVFTNVEYAAIHNYGGLVKLPERINYHHRNGKFASKRTWDAAVRRVQAGKGSSGMQASITGARTVSIPQRQFLPDAQRGLPREWISAFSDIATELRKGAVGQ